MLPDLHELVNSAHSANDRPVANRYMTRYLRVVTHYTIIAHKTIVCEMAIGHDQAILPDHGFITILGTTVYGYEFTDRGSIAYIYVGVFTLEFQILRDCCDNGAGEYPAVLPDPCSLHDRYIRPDPCAFTDLNVLVNKC